MSFYLIFNISQYVVYFCAENESCVFVIIFSLKSQNVFSAGQDKKETWRSFHLLVWISLLPSVIAVLAPGVRLSGLLSCNLSANQSSLPSQSSSHCQALLLSPSPSGDPPVFWCRWVFCLLLFLSRQGLCLPPVSSVFALWVHILRSIFLIRSSLACKTQDRRFSVRRFQATRVSHKADFIPSSLCERGQRRGACLVCSSAWVCLSGRGQASGQSERRMTSSLHRTYLFPSSDWGSVLSAYLIPADNDIQGWTPRQRPRKIISLSSSSSSSSSTLLQTCVWISRKVLCHLFQLFCSSRGISAEWLPETNSLISPVQLSTWILYLCFKSLHFSWFS